MQISLTMPLLASSEAPAEYWESPGVILLKLTAIMVLVLLNGFFVASEFAMVKVRASQLDALGSANRRASSARYVLRHLDAYLSATQLGITLASLGLGWLGEPFLAQMIEPFFTLAGVKSIGLIHAVSFGLSFAIITALHIILGELAPKSLAIRKALPTTLWVSTPMRIFHAVFSPAIWVLNGVANWLLKNFFGINPIGEHEASHSEEELRLIIAQSEMTNEVSALGKQVFINALDLRQRTVREIMTPRGKVDFLDAGESFQENLARIKASRRTRFPLCEGDLDHAMGLVHIRDAFTQADEPNPSLNAVRRDLLTVPETISLERLLALLRDQRQHLALALDEFGGSAGIVTLTDALAEVVGAIPGHDDAPGENLRRLSEDEVEVDGAFPLHDLSDVIGIQWQNPEVSTVGGYVTWKLGRLPKEGETVNLDNYAVTVTQADGRRVKQVRLRRLEE
jgi:CBS domain containing-hemolysin-like protein